MFVSGCRYGITISWGVYNNELTSRDGTKIAQYVKFK